jgi:regulator of sigma E protease
MTYLLIVLLLAVLILIHELGHFLVAKWTRIPVERFSIGFGPKLWGFKRGPTEYWISAIPLGGYVLLALRDERELFRIPLAKRLLFLLGGPAANLALPVLLFIGLNVAAGDVSLYDIFVGPVIQTFDLLCRIVAALPQLFVRPEGLSGVIGIVAMGGEYVASDLTKAVQFTIFLSVNFAVFNLLPIPVLDGGKILLFLVETVYPKAVRLYVPLTIIGVVLVLGLIVYVTALDIGRIVT